MSRILCLLFLTLSITHAAVLEAKDYETAASLAKKEQRPYAILIHGSSWHPASQKFLDLLWKSPEFRSSLDEAFIISDIHIKQHLSEEQTKAEELAYKSWENRKISSFPCIQIYSPDGKLLKSYKGSDLRKISTLSALTTHLNSTRTAISKRNELLQKATDARENNNPKLEAELLSQALQLSLTQDSTIIKQLEKADPSDKLGVLAENNFKNWQYIRHITELIKDNKIPQALEETDKLLTQTNKSKFNTEQLAIAYGARGIALTANGELTKAWTQFEKAKSIDPNGPAGEAMHQYGIRIAFIPSRIGFPPTSEVSKHDIGVNLTQDRANFTMSSAHKAYDQEQHHPMLLSGPHAPGNHAFMTASENNPSIIIDLANTCTIKAARIINTKRNNDRKRAATLQMHISTDAKNWELVWKANKAEASWDILLEHPARARYVKLSLNSKENQSLNLLAVDLFGDAPKAVTP